METGEVIIVNGRRLRKIGERHGDVPKRDVPKVKKKPLPNINKVKAPTESYKQKQRLLETRKVELRDRATKAEIHFKYHLKKNNIKFIFQKGVIGGKTFAIADFYIHDLNLIVELDGGYHQTEQQRLRDMLKDKDYAKRGYSILRIQNRDVYDFKYDELKISCAKGKFRQYILDMLTAYKGTIVRTWV